MQIFYIISNMIVVLCMMYKIFRLQVISKALANLLHDNIDLDIKIGSNINSVITNHSRELAQLKRDVSLLNKGQNND